MKFVQEALRATRVLSISIISNDKTKRMLTSTCHLNIQLIVRSLIGALPYI